MSKRTQVGWRTDRSRPTFILNSEGHIVASVNHKDKTLPMEANRALIAAAPDLLEACKTALALLEVRMESGAGSFDFDARDQLRAALAKAEGVEK